MKKYSFIIVSLLSSLFISLSALMLAGCSEPSSNDDANVLLNEARLALRNAKYDEARALIDSLRHKYPTAFGARRASIFVADSIELADARDSLRIADSLEIFRGFQLDDMKKLFVFEKQERFQTVGYYVLPAHAGSKVHLSFFPEVDESGKLLLVSIDKNRKYSFTEVPIGEDDSEYRNELYQKKTQEQRTGIDMCEQLATCFLLYKQAKELKEKMSWKVRFFERKLEEDKKR